MNPILATAAAASVASLVIKATALLGAAALVQAAWGRRASAATRHLVWTLALVSVLALPLAALVLPEWPVIVLRTASAPDVTPPVVGTPNAPAPARSATVDASAFPSDQNASDPARMPPQAGRLSWTAIGASVYAIGALGLLFYLIAQHWSVRRLARRANLVREPDWMRLLADCGGRLGVRRLVRLLRSRAHSLPVAFGTRHPSIMIPSIAETWDGDRRRAVLLHELAHVARYDCLTQTLAMVACALYWFHPGVWWVARRLRIERELACDDRVIAAGTEPREYAQHLLEIAYASGGHRAPALAVSMARPRQLEGRLLAALDVARNRRVPAIGIRVASAIGAAALMVVVACATPRAAAATEGSTDQVQFKAHPFPELVRDSWHALTNGRFDGAWRAVAEMFGLVQEGTGTWEIRPTDAKATVHLRLTERNSSSGRNVPIEQLDGLTAAQLTGAGGPVQFRVKRDAGTFSFEGVIRNGVGAGTFSFAPDANFPAELAKRGFARPSASEQYQLARADIGYAFLDELTKQGYAKPETAALVRAGQHGVDTEYLREMGAIGYRQGSLEPLITLRDHGVTPGYARDLADLGYKGLSADALRNTRDHGITPQYVREMRDAGFGSMPLDQLVNVRDHGITPEYVRELADAGHKNLSLERLLRARDHGVTPDYVRDMSRLGYSLPIDDLVNARDHGITTEYVREMAAQGYANVPIATLIKVRDHGVGPEFAKELRALGYDRLPLEDLVTLRDYGLTAEKIRSANTRAGTRLPVDLLKQLAGGRE